MKRESLQIEKKRGRVGRLRCVTLGKLGLLTDLRTPQSQGEPA